MHRAVTSITRANLRSSSSLPCRYISGRRYPPSSRTFHTSQRQRINDQGAAGPSASSIQDVTSSDTTTAQNLPSTLDSNEYEEALEHGKTLLNDADEQWPGIADWSRYGDGIPIASREKMRKNIAERRVGEARSSSKGHGSFRRRAMRNYREEAVLSIPKIPQWFLDRNVEFHADIPEVEKLIRLDSAFQNVSPDDYAEAVRFIKEEEQTEDSTRRHKIDKQLFTEITALARSGLKSATSDKNEDTSVSKPHLVLQSSQEGGTVFLSRVAEAVAKTLGADLIRLDPSTVSELVMDLGADVPSKMADQMKFMAYEAYAVDNDLIEEEEEDGEDDFGDSSSGMKPFQSILDNIRRPKGNSSSGSRKMPYKFNVVIPKIITKQLSDGFSGGWVNGFVPTSSANGSGNAVEGEDASKVTLLIETFLDSVLLKASANKALDSATYEDRKPLIITIADYLEVQTTKAGGALLDKLHEIVQERRSDGQEILIIGLSSAEDLLPSTNKAGLQKWQASAGQGPYRTIITAPSSWNIDQMFEQDEKSRTRHLNIRHLQDMLRRLAWSKNTLGEWCWKSRGEIDQTSFGAHFDSTVWSVDRINRVAAVALGLVTEDRPQVDEELAGEALRMITESDNKKFALLHAREEEATEDDGSVSSTSPDPQSVLSKVRKNANSHEKKMLHGVIDRKDIKTTFSSVHVPDSTIQALRTLTSLSLQRPDAFTYGVLANDKIPGLLLYGPPGTGKTLLAKAVAGESGATVLEVSGSDIYDMYVGEGEKNVRAIFTLAQKLSPCVVFIDEADAILGSRNSATNRTTHRELINQFLREWDGLSSKNSSAFIMVATNRPFDLDDAVLRRLPRRLLVDLPTEKDREAIFKIHLTDEKLDPSVSLPSLAERTPFYSGSDIKNICVAAALQAVQEEYDAKVLFESKQQTPPPTTTSSTNEPSPEPEKYTYPPIRTLTQSHFDRALGDISASISEDMSSLAAIRKFDEKYGDRRGRRKKGGVGFGMKSTGDAEREERDGGRVRKEVLAGV